MDSKKVFALGAPLLALALSILLPSCEFLLPPQTSSPGTGGDKPGAVESVQRPTSVAGFAAAPGGDFAASLAWTAPASGVGILVVLLPAGEVWAPLDGTSYATGAAAGSGTVVFAGTGAFCSASGLTIGQACCFLCFAYNSKHEYSPAVDASYLVPEPPPKFAGFDFALEEGDFWEYDYYYSKYADWGYTDFSYHRTIVVQLGAPSTIGGREAFPLSLPLATATGFEPRWKWLTLEKSVLLGSTYAGVGLPESAVWTTILDAKTGFWKGGGFFVTRSDTEFSQAGQGTEIIGGSLTTVVKIGSGSATDQTYTYVPDYGYVASGEAIYSNTSEYFIPDVGPAGYDDSFSLYSSSYQSSERESVSLMTSSRTSVVPRDFWASYWVNASSVGQFDETKAGPGLAVLDTSDYRGTVTSATFTMLPTEREALYSLLISARADWVETTAAKGISDLDLGGVVIIRPPTVSEGIKFATGGRQYSLPQTSSAYSAVKAAILALTT